MNITEEKLNANRENAQHSTGPRTDEGKSRPKLNGLRHGLSGQTVVLPTEDMSVYLAFVEKQFIALEPDSDIERQLAQRYANEQWRLNRCTTAANSYIALGHAGSTSDSDVDHPELHAAFTEARQIMENVKTFELFSRYEGRIARMAQATLKQLRDEQARRKEQQQKEMYHAIPFRQYKQMLQEHFNPAEFGFASSTAQIDQQILFRETLAKAQIAKEVGFNPEKFRIKLAQS